MSWTFTLWRTGQVGRNLMGSLDEAFGTVHERIPEQVLDMTHAVLLYLRGASRPEIYTVQRNKTSAVVRVRMTSGGLVQLLRTR
jgi:hypothetical protein